MGQLRKSFCPIFSKTGSCLHLLIQEHRLWGTVGFIPTPPLTSTVTLGELLAHSISSYKMRAVTPASQDWDNWMNLYA